MKFRMFAISVFAFGAVSLALVLVLSRSQTRFVPDPDFAAATSVVTDENFADLVLASDKPVVVDFYGNYCVVCKKLEPKLLSLAKEYSEVADFARVNVQDAPELIQRYEVQQVPTLVVFHQGEVRFHRSGLDALPPLQTVLEAANREKLL